MVFYNFVPFYFKYIDVLWPYDYATKNYSSHTPDKFDQFLKDNFLTGGAILHDTLHEDNCYHCACFKIFTFLSYHLIFKLFSENEKSSFFWKSPICDIVWQWPAAGWYLLLRKNWLPQFNLKSGFKHPEF
jgi:hypothetical protein